MNLTLNQKQTAQAVVNIFETGRVRGDYGQVTLLPGDTGHLTYGRAQTTLASGNLSRLIAAYCQREGEFSADLKGYLGRLSTRDLSLDDDLQFRQILHDAGADSEMIEAQDIFFDEVYWEPTLRSAEYIGAESVLGASIIFDGRIHGSWHARRDQTNRDHGILAEIGETTWFERYVAVRKNWLATHPNALLQKTVYRMESYEELIRDGVWDMALPVTVRGIRIDEASLASGPLPVRVSAAEVETPLLRLTEPYTRGPDVERLQQDLARSGLEISVDGVFGRDTDAVIRVFQDRNGLSPDGIVGPATWAALEN